MEIASFARFVNILYAKDQVDANKDLLFFTPCEELNGGNLLYELASEYELIKPFLEKIDMTLIELMNRNVKNVYKYMDKNLNIKAVQQNIITS